MRQLKYHEQKLLKKVDFLTWKSDSTPREIQTMRRYHLQSRSDYHHYNSLVGSIRHLSHLISHLPSTDPFRSKYESLLLSKLYDVGLVDRGAKMSDVEGGAAGKGGKVTVGAICRRRIGVVMVHLKMAETVKKAVEFVEQGHVRVGVDGVNDPAFLVTRSMEDFVTWVDSSKLKRHIMKYNDELDDFDLMA